MVAGLFYISHIVVDLVRIRRISHIHHIVTIVVFDNMHVFFRVLPLLVVAVCFIFLGTAFYSYSLSKSNAFFKLCVSVSFSPSVILPFHMLIPCLIFISSTPVYSLFTLLLNFCYHKIQCNTNYCSQNLKEI